MTTVPASTQGSNASVLWLALPPDKSTLGPNQQSGSIMLLSPKTPNLNSPEDWFENASSSLQVKPVTLLPAEGTETQDKTLKDQTSSASRKIWKVPSRRATLAGGLVYFMLKMSTDLQYYGARSLGKIMTLILMRHLPEAALVGGTCGFLLSKLLYLETVKIPSSNKIPSASEVSGHSMQERK